MRSEISNSAFEAIVKGYQATYPSFDIEGIDEGKIAALIDSGALPLTTDNLAFIRSKYGPLAIWLAATDADGYLRLIIGDSAQIPFDEGEVLGLLSMPDFPEPSKLKLLEGFASPIRLCKEYPPSLQAAICRTRFSPKDLESLPTLFRSSDSDLRNAALDRATASFRDMMAEGIEIPWRMVADMARPISAAHGREAALGLIAWKLDRSTQTEKPALRQALIECFSSVGEGDYEKLLRGSQVQLPDTQPDRTLVRSLREHGFCTVDKRGLSASGRIIVHPKGYSKTAKAR